MKPFAIYLLLIGAFLSIMEAKPVKERLELVEGDMYMTKEQKEAYTELHNGRVRRAAIKDRYLWPNGRVYYTFSADMTDDDKAKVREAMQHWEDNTCIRFVERTDQRAYAEISKCCDCRALVGFGNMPRQEISIGSGRWICPLGSIIHELGHAIGFHHEHNRLDRDRFVDVNETNMWAGLSINNVNFKKVNARWYDSRGHDYDYESIMHYSRWQGAKDRQSPVLIPKPDDTVEIGERTELSAGDIAQTKDIYKCDAQGDSHFFYDHSQDEAQGKNKKKEKKPEILQ